MKKMIVSCFYDNKAKCYIGDLMLLHSEFEASQMAQSFDARFGKNGDFCVHKLGDFDNEVGLLSCMPVELPKFVSSEDEEISAEIGEVKESLTHNNE